MGSRYNLRIFSQSNDFFHQNPIMRNTKHNKVHVRLVLRVCKQYVLDYAVMSMANLH